MHDITASQGSLTSVSRQATNTLPEPHIAPEYHRAPPTHRAQRGTAQCPRQWIAHPPLLHSGSSVPGKTGYCRGQRWGLGRAEDRDGAVHEGIS